MVKKSKSRISQKKKTQSKKIIKKVKAAIANPTKIKAKEKKKVEKKLPAKKVAKVKEKKEEMQKTLYMLTAEEMKQINELLTRPIVRQTLIDVGGENALAIIRNFDRALSDEEIAKRLKLKISDVRATLNSLHSEGLVMYDRYKDNETGWYSYSWWLNKERIFKWVEEKTKKFSVAASSNGSEHYVCPFCGVSTIVDFSNAMDKNFRCDICGKPLEYLDEELMQKLGIVETKTFVRVLK
jgi:transcription factor E